jgi:hypothetical protein
MQIWRSSIYLTGLVALCLVSTPNSPRAEEAQPSDKGAIVEGAGFTLFDMESIKESRMKPSRDKKSRSRARTLAPRNASTGSPSAQRGRQRSTISS